MIDLQKLTDLINDSEQLKRSSKQMTLGEFITELSLLEPSLEIKTSDGTSLDGVISYRGYYCDLAFTPSNTPMPLGFILSHAENSLGKVFHGYKGGEFTMTKSTPLWVAEYGGLGSCIMGVEQQGNIAMITLKEE